MKKKIKENTAENFLKCEHAIVMEKLRLLREEKHFQDKKKTQTTRYDYVFLVAHNTPTF